MKMGAPQMDEKQCIEKERERKSVLTIASYACEHHQGWLIQTAWTILCQDIAF